MIMKTIYITIFFLFSLSIYCNQISCTEELTDLDNKKKIRSTNLSFDTVETLVFKTSDGWGYNIIVNEKIYIHQSHIPAINELKSFANSEDALRVAEYAVKKLRLTQRLPSITYHELDSLSVL